MSRRGLALFLALGVIWGLPYLLIKVAVRDVSPAVLVLVRTGGGAALLLPFAVRAGALRPALARWRPLLAFSVCELIVPWYLLSSAERRLSSSLSGLLVAATPLVGGVLALATGSDRLGGRRGAGLLVGFVGVGALVGFDVGRSEVLAALSIGVVSVGYATGPWLMSRYLGDVPRLGVLSASLACCALVYAPLAAVSLPNRAPSGGAIAAMATLTVLCTAVALVVFTHLISEVGAVRATVITYVNPAVAVLLGVTVLDERFTLATAVGFALVIAGSVLATRPAPVARVPALEEVGPRAA